jgi:hypothetical protein
MFHNVKAPNIACTEPRQSAPGLAWWQSVWLEVGSSKAMLTRPDHRSSPGCYATGNANRWLAPCSNMSQPSKREKR